MSRAVALGAGIPADGASGRHAGLRARATPPAAAGVEVVAGLFDARLGDSATAVLRGQPGRRTTAWRRGVAASQSGWTLACVLTLFLAADQMLTSVLSLVGPEIRASLGMSEGRYAFMLSQRSNAAATVAILIAWNLHKRQNRRSIAVQAALGTALGSVLMAVSNSFWPLFLAVGITTSTAGAIWAVHRPMLMDGYVPAVRLRILTIHQSGFLLGTLLGPLVVLLAGSAAGLSWRGVLIVTGATASAVAVAGLLIVTPASGRHDTHELRELAAEELEVTDEEADALAQQSEGARLGFGETIRRLMLVPTVRQLLGAFAVLGVVVTPLLTYVGFFLQDHWQLTIAGRSTVLILASVLAVPILAAIAIHGERLYRDAPSELIRLAGWLLAGLAGALLVTALSPALPITVAALGAVVGLSLALVPVLVHVTMGVVQPHDRPALGALLAVFLVAVGGQGGALLLGGVNTRFGPGAAIATLALPALAAALLARKAIRTADLDLQALAEAVLEEEEVRIDASRGRHIPMLACRGIDFSYGQLQVLFDVNFTVDDGEMVALLGTNGAGKSSLLRVISGLGLPESGTVRLNGRDITHVDAERRVAMGISQVPGGRAVFGALTVVENLRVLGSLHGRNKSAIDAGIDESFAAFPRLAERRNQLASTLSGGEQQMLGLSTAFLVKPQLLLIDELSLGLAPKIVGELLDMVRKINDAGAAVVLVEQSVNIALSVVNHAYFMEKGEMRFDGPSKELLGRPDLLRSVFLEGARKGIA